MTAEEQQALSQQIAEALDAVGLGEYAYHQICNRCENRKGYLPQFFTPDSPCTARNCDGVFVIRPNDFTDATALLAAVEEWLGQRAGVRTITTEWWMNAKTWVCKISEYRYLLKSVVGIGKHPTNRTLAEATAFLAVLTEGVEE